MAVDPQQLLRGLQRPYVPGPNVQGALRARLEALLKRGVQARATPVGYRIQGPRPAALAGNAQRDAMIAGWSGRVPRLVAGLPTLLGLRRRLLLRRHRLPLRGLRCLRVVGPRYPTGPNPGVTATQMQQLGLGSPTGQTKPPYYPQPAFAPNAVWNGYAWVDPIGGGVYPPGAHR